MMPHQKFLFATGCVAQAAVGRSQTTVTLYSFKPEIKKLHPYFTDAVVDEILGWRTGSEIPLSPKKDMDERLRGASGTVRVVSRHTLHRLATSKTATPKIVPHGHPLDDGCFYWLLPARRRTSPKK